MNPEPPVTEKEFDPVEGFIKYHAETWLELVVSKILVMEAPLYFKVVGSVVEFRYTTRPVALPPTEKLAPLILPATAAALSKVIAANAVSGAERISNANIVRRRYFIASQRLGVSAP